MEEPVPIDSFITGEKRFRCHDKIDSISCDLTRNSCILSSNGVSYKACQISSGGKLENFTSRTVQEDSFSVLIFTPAFNSFEFRREYGVFPVEYIVSHGVRNVVLVGLDVVASWEFGLMARNDIRLVYLPVDSALRGGFLPLTGLVDAGVKVGLGSGFLDGRMGVCDFRGVVWAAVLNQCSILRGWDACRGVLASVVGGWEVYGLRSGVLEGVRNIDGKRAFGVLYRYARTGVWSLDSDAEGLFEEAPDDG